MKRLTQYNGVVVAVAAAQAERLGRGPGAI